MGFDIEVHVYGEHRHPQSLRHFKMRLTIHGSQFADVDLIVASPPCQESSLHGDAVDAGEGEGCSDPGR